MRRWAGQRQPVAGMFGEEPAVVGESANVADGDVADAGSEVCPMCEAFLATMTTALVVGARGMRNLFIMSGCPVTGCAAQRGGYLQPAPGDPGIGDAHVALVVPEFVF